MNKWKDYILLGLVSFSLLIFEFLLSQELVFLYGMGLFYWVIPLMMLGFSLGSAISRVKFLNKIYQETLILLYILFMFFSLYLLIKFRVVFIQSPSVITSFALHPFNNILKLLIMLIWPFIILGLYFGRAYSEFKNLGIVFLSNGVGLTLGAICSGKIYRFFGWPGGIFFIMSLLLFSLFLFDRKNFIFYSFTISLFILLYIAGFLRPDWPPRRFRYTRNQNEKNILTRYSDLVRTDVLKSNGGRYRIVTNGTTSTTIIRFSESDNPLILYGTREKEGGIPFSLGDYQRVLIVGSGGGKEIYKSLMAGARNIKAVEINPVIISLMKNEFREYSGNIYLHPDVEVINREGRDYVRNTQEKFDLINLVGIDTFSSHPSLSPFTFEAYLYTKEALRRYFDILSEGGCIMIVRLQSVFREINATLEILRLYKSIESLNLNEHAIIMRKEDVSKRDDMELASYTLLLFKSKVDGILLSKLKVSDDELLYSPGNIYKIKDIENDYKEIFNISLLRDDCPALYNFEKWQKNLPFIFKLFCIAFPLTIILSLLGKVNLKKTIFYLLLGIGCIALQLNLVGRLVLFLGNPAYSMQVVLASFLLFGGWGGYLGARHKVNTKRYLFLQALFSFLFIFICGWLYTLNIGSQILKNTLAFLLAAPIGFFSAIPFSQALSREEKRHIMYALDGIGTVLGAILLYFIQTYWGFNAGFIFITLIYSLVVLLV